MLQEQELKTFVEGTTNYFEVAAQQPASIGSPYLTEGSPAVHDYTGVINISGKREGVVYFTAPRAMLTVLLMKMREMPESLMAPKKRSFRLAAEDSGPL